MRESNFTQVKKRREKFTTMINPDLRDKIKKVAIDEKRYVADIIEMLLEGFLFQKPQKLIKEENIFTKIRKKREKFTTTINPDLRDKIKKVAIDIKKSVADIIEMLLEVFLFQKLKKSTNIN